MSKLHYWLLRLEKGKKNKKEEDKLDLGFSILIIIIMKINLINLDSHGMMYRYLSFTISPLSYGKIANNSEGVDN